MSPYSESETFPRGRRKWLVPIAGAFLVGPYGVMLNDGPSGLIPWIATAIAVAAGALFAGAGIARPRRSVIVDGDARTIAVTTTAPLPRIGVRHAEHGFDEVLATGVREVGTKKTPSHGFCPVVSLGDPGSELELRRQPSAEHAQDVIDHLVLLGLPGSSRASQRDAILDAAPPVTWL